MIKIAFGRHFESAHAVQQCVVALADAHPCMLIVFCGGKHDPHEVLSALRDRYDDIPIVGGSAAGAIWNGGSGYSGLEIGILAIVSPDLLPQVLVSGDMLDREWQAGQDLGIRVAAAATDHAVAILFFDSVAKTDPLHLHPASTIVAGVTDGLGDKPVRLLGGGMLTDMNLSDGWIFDGSQVRRHAAVALVFPPGVAAEIGILHGCRPVSTFMEITRIDGAEVFELDGQPALLVIERMLGLPLGGSRGQDLSLIATLGQKQGDPFADYDENAYVNRLILSANRDVGSITLFEPDFERGTRVQIMARDNALMLDSVRNGIAAINRNAEGLESFLALYIDCAGRASARSGAPVEEADLVRQSLPPGLPLLGFYSGVEVAPFEGYSRPLDWTGVIAILHRVRSPQTR
jgi:hypothetical protein